MRVGQARMMEYMVLVIFIIMLLLAFMIMLTVHQVGSIKKAGRENTYAQSLMITRFMLNTPYLNNPRNAEGSMFDDSKLTAALCEELEKIIGGGWFAWVRIPSPDEKICDKTTYPDCNKWIICEKKTQKAETCVHEVPVNIYRKLSNEIEIGTLTVGLYGKCS